MNEEKTEGGQAPNFDDLVEKIGGRVSATTAELEERLAERLMKLDERVGSVESRFSAPKEEEKPSDWEYMDDDQKFQYVQNQVKQELGQTRQELATRQSALEAARLAPRVAKSWEYEVEGAAEIATEILESIALSNPERFSNLDEQTKADIIDLSERRAQKRAPKIPQDTAQGYQKDLDSEAQRIKDEYAKSGITIDDEKAQRLAKLVKSY